MSDLSKLLIIIAIAFLVSGFVNGKIDDLERGKLQGIGMTLLVVGFMCRGVKE